MARRWFRRPFRDVETGQQGSVVAISGSLGPPNPCGNQEGLVSAAITVSSAAYGVMVRHICSPGGFATPQGKQRWEMAEARITLRMCDRRTCSDFCVACGMMYDVSQRRAISPGLPGSRAARCTPHATQGPRCSTSEPANGRGGDPPHPRLCARQTGSLNGWQHRLNSPDDSRCPHQQTAALREAATVTRELTSAASQRFAALGRRRWSTSHRALLVSTPSSKNCSSDAAHNHIHRSRCPQPRQSDTASSPVPSLSRFRLCVCLRHYSHDDDDEIHSDPPSQSSAFTFSPT